MRKFLSLAVTLFCMATVCAIPAKRVWRTFTQPDGSIIELMLVGDEHLHFYLTRDDVPVVEKDEAFYYAKPGKRCAESTGVLAKEAVRRTVGDRQAMHTLAEMASLREMAIEKGMKRVKRVGETDHPNYPGHKKGLIILANFSDKKFYDYTEEDGGMATWDRYNAIANEEGYVNEQYGAVGSVHDYYFDQSFGKFNLTFDVVGPVNLDKRVSYYGKNVDGSDVYAPEMIMECCQAVDSIVDFNDYDWDGDGVVEEVFVLYAGFGEATGGASTTVWPHMWTFDEGSQYNENVPKYFELDGARINVYACSNELYSNKGITEMGLGVICHEFSHCLGLPDFYDTGYGGAFGMGDWDILDHGSYNGPAGIGWVPAGYTSYERNYAGWLTLNELTYDRWVVNQKPLNERGNAYVIYNDNNRNEYYLLENRNQTKWDAYIPGSGLLVIHVDYNRNLWENNLVNTVGKGNTHQRMTILHASNNVRGGNDAYPYNGNDSITDLSEPSASLYNANIDGTKLMHKAITQITRDSDTGYVSFLFSNNNKETSVDGMELDLRPGNNYCTAYNMNGCIVGRGKEEEVVAKLTKGTYIIKTEGKTRKVVIYL